MEWLGYLGLVMLGWWAGRALLEREFRKERLEEWERRMGGPFNTPND